MAFMDHPIVEKIIKDGIDSVNLSMLGPQAKKKILTEVGEKLYKQGKFKEAVRIAEESGDMQKLE